MLSYISLRLGFLFFIYSSGWILFINLSSSSLIISSANSNLLLNTSSEFFFFISVIALSNSAFGSFVISISLLILYLVRCCHRVSFTSSSVVAFSSLNVFIEASLKSLSVKSDIWSFLQAVSAACFIPCVWVTLSCVFAYLVISCCC